MKLDLLIRGATLYDGSGGAPYAADIGVSEGKIVAVSPDLSADADEIVEATGLAVMPGIIDLHTHYDAQVTWDPTCSPSPALGVTTAVLGNCGFAIAPCPAPMRDVSLRNLSVVEGMDLQSLQAGMRWEFETFPEYLDFIKRQQPHLNVAVFAGHSTIRMAVLGEEASRRSEVTEAELEAMRRLTREAMEAGAIGFSSSFSPNQSGWEGVPMPSTVAMDEELASLVGVLGEVGRGVFMSATGPRANPEYMEKLSADTGRPVFISTVLAMYNDRDPDAALAMYKRCSDALERGHEVYIQTSCQPLSFDFDLLEPYVFYGHDSFEAVQSVRSNREELARLYRDEGFRERFRANLRDPRPGMLFNGDWSQVELSPSMAQNAGLTQRTIQDLAREAGADPVSWLLDFALSEDLATRFVGKFYNNRDAGVAPLLKHPASVITLSDAGAHMTYLCDAGFGLHLLSHWVREVGSFSLAEAVRRLTSHPADLYRIPDRGRIQPGAWADLMLFDPKTVGMSKLKSVRDLPGGAARKIREAIGVHAVWVNGVRTVDQGRYVATSGGGQVITKFNA